VLAVDQRNPAQVHAGDSLTVSSNGFLCGYFANDGKPVEYWLVLSGSTPGGESFRFARSTHQKTARSPSVRQLRHAHAGCPIRLSAPRYPR